MSDPTAAPWPRTNTAGTLFVDDVAAAKQLYADVFGLPVHDEDDDTRRASGATSPSRWSRLASGGGFRTKCAGRARADECADPRRDEGG